jgi:hypothetical protein
LKRANRDAEQRGELRLRQSCLLARFDDGRRDDLHPTRLHVADRLEQLGRQVALGACISPRRLFD